MLGYVPGLMWLRSCARDRRLIWQLCGTAGVTLLTTESYTDFVRAQDRTSLVILVKG